jgi:hypothetical protein
VAAGAAGAAEVSAGPALAEEPALSDAALPAGWARLGAELAGWPPPQAAVTAQAATAAPAATSVCHRVLPVITPRL